MKILNLNYEMHLTANDVRTEEDYGVIVRTEYVDEIERLLNREVKALYIMENDCCYPILMIEWKWFLNDNDQFILHPVECSDDDLSLFRELEIY